VSVTNNVSAPPNTQNSLFDLFSCISPAKSLIGDSLPQPIQTEIFPVRCPKMPNDLKSTSTSSHSSSNLKPSVFVDKSTNKDSPSSNQRQPNLTYRGCLSSRKISTSPLNNKKFSGTNSSSIPFSSSGKSVKSNFVGNLKIIPKNKSLFVSGFHESTMESENLEFLKRKSSSFSNASFLCIRKLNSKTRRDVFGFKIDLCPKLFSIIYNEGFWPDGVLYQEFIKRP